MASTDPTFDDLSLYGSIKWACKRMGKSTNWFYRHRDQLIANEGFPRVDSVTNLYIKADIEAWIERRRQIPDKMTVQTTTESHPRINPDAL